MIERTTIALAARPRLAFLGLLVGLATGLAAVQAQTPATPPDPAVIRDVAMKTMAAQLETSNQQLLQRWILWNARAYQQQLFGTAIGDARTPAGRRLVDFGDSDAYARQVVAPPVGGGRSRIVWDDVPAPKFEPNDNNIHMPRKTFGMNGGAASTCWHELNHDLLDLHIGNLRRGMANPLPTPAVWGSLLNNDNDEDHYVIEGLGERTMDWLCLLAITKRFEKGIPLAAKAEADLRAAGKPVNWQVEHEAWAAPLKAWAESWPAARKILPLPMEYRRVYDRFCGVSLPLPEDVQRFYMEGGVVDAGGKAIRVPEWVVAPVPVLCDVTVQDSDREAPRPVDKNMVGRFNVHLPENYKGKLQATRGQLLVALRTTDDPAFLAVSIGGQSLAGAADKAHLGRLFEINLAPHREALLAGKGFRVTLTRPLEGLHDKMKNKAYAVVVSYRDPSKAGSASLYRPARAQIDMTIAAKDIPASPTGAAAAPVAGGAAGGKQKMRFLDDVERWKLSYWQLVEESGKQHNKDAFNKITSTVTGGSGSAGVQWTQEDYRPDSKTYKQQVNISATASWAVPPQRINFGQKVPILWNVAVKNWDTGAGLELTCNGGNLYLTDQKVIQRTNPKSLSIGSFQMTLTGPDDPTARIEGVFTTLYVKFAATGGWYLHKYKYQLIRGPELVPDTGGPIAAPPPAPVSSGAPPFVGKMTRQSPAAAPPIPAELDNVPPKPGDVVPLAPPEVSPPAIHSARPLWYTHPSGGYRLPLPPGWRICPTAPGADTDVLMAHDNATAICCARDFGEIASPADAAEAYAAHLGKVCPGAPVARSVAAGATVLIAGVHNRDAGRTLWHVYLLKDKRAYYLTVAVQPSGSQPKMPTTVLKAMGDMVWQK